MPQSPSFHSHSSQAIASSAFPQFSSGLFYQPQMMLLSPLSSQMDHLSPRNVAFDFSSESVQNTSSAFHFQQVHSTPAYTYPYPVHFEVDTESAVSQESMDTDCNGFDWSFVQSNDRRSSILKWKEKKMRIQNGLAQRKVYQRRQKISRGRHRIGGKFVSEEEWALYHQTKVE